MSNSTFSNNNGGRVGGAIISRGGTVSDSSFSSNTARSLGGAIVNFGALMTVTNSTFSNNSATDAFGTAGAIDNGGAPGSALTVTNSTFSGNSAGFLGGGIRNELDGTLTVTNCTFTGNNTARFNGGGAFSNRGTGTLRNTIVANSPSGGNCSGTFTDGGGNLSYPDATCPGLNVDPLLAPWRATAARRSPMHWGRVAPQLTPGLMATVPAPISAELPVHSAPTAISVRTSLRRPRTTPPPPTRVWTSSSRLDPHAERP